MSGGAPPRTAVPAWVARCGLLKRPDAGRPCRRSRTPAATKPRAGRGGGAVDARDGGEETALLLPRRQLLVDPAPCLQLHGHQFGHVALDQAAMGPGDVVSGLKGRMRSCR